MTIRQYLSADHERLDELLSRAISRPLIDAATYTEFRAGLLRHIAMEEKILMAEMRCRGDDALRSIITVLHLDHAAIASLLVPSPTHALVTTLRTVLDEHNPLEEGPDGLYARCDEAFGDEGPATIARMQAIAPVRASQYLDEARVHEHIARMLEARARR